MFRFLAIVVLMFSGEVFAADNQTLLTGKNLKMATEMNNAYAQHLYSSTCVARQKSYYLPKTLTLDEQAKRIKGFQSSCDCMANLIIKKTSPNAVIDYATKMYGVSAKVKTNKDGTFKVDPTPQYKAIGDLTRDKDARRSCGFQK